MSHYQGSSYRPGGDLYRPNNRQNYEGKAPGYGQGRPGDRGPGMRPHNTHNTGRPPQQGHGFRGNGPNERRFQGNQNNYVPHTPNNAYNQGYQNHRMPHIDANSAPNGYGALNHNTPNFNGRQAYGANANYKSNYVPAHPSAPKPFQQKRPTDTYHQAYLQTQAESQLWMGDLDPRWSENDIMGIWTEVGDTPLSVKIIRDKQGKPQYSFVTFPNQQAVDAALQKNRAPVPGSQRFFKLNYASGGTHTDSRAPVNRVRNTPEATRGHSDYSLFVGDLATEVTEPELYARFNQEYPGEVKQVKIMMDVNTGASKGFGFVRFLSVEAQQKALKTMNGAVIGQRAIRLGIANGGSLEPSTTAAKKTNESLLTTVHIAQKQPTLTPFTDPNNTTISVKGLISSITRDELVAHFLPFGHLVYCKVDYINHIAYVKYLLRASAEKALLYMHGLVVNGSRLVLRWGRDKPSTEGNLRFAPANKGGAYTAAEKAPNVYGSLPTNVVFEDLSDEQMKSLNFTTKLHHLTVSELNEENEQKIKNRKDYLDQAF